MIDLTRWLLQTKFGKPIARYGSIALPLSCSPAFLTLVGGADEKRRLRSERMSDEIGNCLRYEGEELTERERPENRKDGEGRFWACVETCNRNWEEG
jgi:hypothetical protein